MYTSTADTINVVVFDNKLVFTVSGVGIVAEDANNLVTTGTLETGTYRWGIPDRKFVARVDTRALPLAGSIVSYMSLDDEAFTTLGTWDSTADVENSFAGSDDKAIEAKFKFGLTRQSATVGPTLTRWTARAYAAPFRSEVFTIPVLLHDVLDVHGKEYSFDATGELAELRTLIADPRIVTLQLKNETVSVIVESLEWTPIDALDREWVWQGTAVVTMRSVQE
jgi:hypothetical protein